MSGPILLQELEVIEIELCSYAVASQKKGSECSSTKNSIIQSYAQHHNALNFNFFAWLRGLRPGVHKAQH